MNKKKKKIDCIRVQRFENGWRLIVERKYKWSYRPEKYFFTDFNSVVDLLGNIDHG